MSTSPIETIRGLLSLVAGSGVRELEVTEGELRVRIVMQEQGVAGTVPPPPAPIAAAAPVIAAPEAPPAPAPADEGTIVPASMHGVFHRAPAPDAAPFVEPGQAVAEGQTLCIMEAMKVFTELKAPVAGVVTAIHAENGQDVTAGQPLFTLGRP